MSIREQPFYTVVAAAAFLPSGEGEQLGSLRGATDRMRRVRLHELTQDVAAEALIGRHRLLRTERRCESNVGDTSKDERSPSIRHHACWAHHAGGVGSQEAQTITI